MEEENEKMEALKKAYAEIILNASKEAAARVMASERKAQLFEHDLRSTKEEAFRMLLRLKQMLDAKTAAAEITYLNQQSKIEELEAQLNEAEGMIVDLRAELKQAQDQLYEVKKQNVQPVNRPFEMGHMTCSDGMSFEKKLIDSEPFVTSTEFGTRLLTSDTKMSSSDLTIIDHGSCMSTKQTVMAYLKSENYIMDDRVLASLRSIEPELYRNGCTQRIRAIERTEDEKSLPEEGPHVPIKNEAAIKLNDRSMNVSKRSYSETERFNAMGTFSGFEAAFAKGTEGFPLKVCKYRKRKILHGKSKSSSCTFRHCRSMRSRRPISANSHCKSFSYISKTVHNSGDRTCTVSSARKSKVGIVQNSSEVVQMMQPDKDQAVSVVRRSLRKRKVKQWDDFTASCRRQGSRPDKSRESSRPFNLKSGEEKSNIVSEARTKEDIDNITGLMDATIHMTADREPTLVKDTKKRNSELIDESVVVKQEDHASKLELENVSFIDIDMLADETSKTTDDAPSQAESNSLFKYTFSRKRKKESLINPDENFSVRESSWKRSSAEKENIASGPLWSNIRTESSKDSRRLVQVARQLISLSGQNSW